MAEKQKPASKDPKWTCSGCKQPNLAERAKCVFCGTGRSAAVSSAGKGGKGSATGGGEEDVFTFEAENGDVIKFKVETGGGQGGGSKKSKKGPGALLFCYRGDKLESQ